MPGPSPTPTHLKLVRGNPGKRAVNKSEPQPAKGIASPPAWLTPDGLAEWDRVTGELDAMGVLHTSDWSVVAMYCEAWEDFQDCIKQMRDGGKIAESKAGAIYQHPIVGMKNKAAERCIKLADRFGLSPAARSRIQTTEQKELDPIDALLARRDA